MASIFEELNVRPVLNAQGNRTLLGGGTPSETVRTLMDDSEEFYVNLGELMDSVGHRIADMLGVEAALVTSGCSAALAVGAAAIISGDNQDNIERMPDTTGMRSEILIQRQLRVKYDRCMTIPGGKLVEIGDEDRTTVDQLEAAIGPNTAAIHYLAPGDRTPGALPIETVIEIGHAHDVPIIVDAAGQVYPTDLLGAYVNMGADLVAYGAKYFGAVNSSGVLTGRKELVDVARKHSFIGFEDSSVRSFGRPMKVDRQEVVAVYGALREWLTMNHEDRFAAYEVRISALRSDLTGLSGITLSDYPAHGPAEGLFIEIDADVVGKTAGDVIEELRAGNPSIWVREHQDDNGLAVRMLTLKENGEQIIAQRLREILS
ncbi:MAG: aminotransferase class V-fold PLP-dependent enzyme [SAR202 cluster bacterium]|nr:aminotransferase class V-fold PLP-dependent enzyme [SAR202 cluster bacterium]